MNIEKLTDDITQAVINHFRSKCDGHGYFYMDEEWAISNLVRKEINKQWVSFDLTITKDGVIDNTEIKVGDRVVLTKCETYNAEVGADGTVVESPFCANNGMIYIRWNRDNPKVHGQMDGGYFKRNFIKINAKSQG